jgi:hypothetical protein
MTSTLHAPRSTTPGQRKLVLDDRPTLALATVETARQILPGHDEDDIKALWEEGLLLYAWNIGLGTAIEARILPDSIDHYKRTHGDQDDPRTEPQVITSLFRAMRVEHKPTVEASAVRLLLNCSSTQVYNLIAANLLKIQPGTTWTRGPNGSALITLDTFQTFLRTRRLP